MTSVFTGVSVLSNIGPRYRVISLTHPEVTDEEFRPGQCVKVNDRWYAIVRRREGFVDLMVTHDSPLTTSQVETLEFPPFSGFLDCDCEKALVVVAGTGLGAVVGLVDQRRRADLETVVRFYGRNASMNDVFRAFPTLDHPLVDFECWDSYTHGRGDVLSDVRRLYSHLVFFAGPRDMGKKIASVAGDRMRFNF